MARSEIYFDTLGLFHFILFHSEVIRKLFRIHIINYRRIGIGRMIWFSCCSRLELENWKLTLIELELFHTYRWPSSASSLKWVVTRMKLSQAQLKLMYVNQICSNAIYHSNERSLKSVVTHFCGYRLENTKHTSIYHLNVRGIISIHHMQNHIVTAIRLTLKSIKLMLVYKRVAACQSIVDFKYLPCLTPRKKGQCMLLRIWSKLQRTQILKRSVSYLTGSYW